MHKLPILITLFLMSICLSGCFSSYPPDIENFQMPYEVDTTSESYILQPPDEVQVLCHDVETIHQQQQKIRPDGKISFEEFGEITAAGKTPAQLSEELKELAREYYKLEYDHPVDVRIFSFQSKVYYVLGQVNAPGPRIYTGRDSVLNAITMAQPNPMAWLERVQIIRPSEHEDERPLIFEMNFDRMAAHGDTTKNVLLQEGDIIYVPPTVLGWLALKIEEVIRPVARAFSGVYTVRQGLDSDRYYY